MKWEYAKYQNRYWLFLWINVEKLNLWIQLREWNECLMRLEGLIPPVNRIYVNVEIKDKEYCVMVGIERELIINHLLITDRY